MLGSTFFWCFKNLEKQTIFLLDNFLSLTFLI